MDDETGCPHVVRAAPPAPDRTLPRHPVAAADRRLLVEACALAGRCPPSRTAFSVGALVVGAAGERLGAGWSRAYDATQHAEEAALAQIDLRDPRLATATLYCSLEPCGERASRPVPCAHLLVDAGVRRVVTAWREPSTFVHAVGWEVLAAAGVDLVEVPDLAPLARRPNRHLERRGASYSRA